MDPGHLADEFQALEKAGCDEMHFHITDGADGTGIGMGIPFIAAAKKACDAHTTAHLRCDRPELLVQQCVKAGAQTIVLPVEKPVHLHRALTQIREAGLQAGLALNPATPLTRLEYVLSSIDRLFLLAKEPCQKGAINLRSLTDRIKILSENIAYLRLHLELIVDGLADTRSIALAAEAGATRFVLGPDSELFDGKKDYAQALEKVRSAVAKSRNLV